jgi:sugar-specific transcriptional regulator TrmB
MIDKLKRLGLTDGEAKAYLALMSLKTSTVGPIVKNSGIAYSNIYDILDRLINKGLVSYTIKGKTKYFQITSEHMFSEYIEKKQKNIEEQKKIFSEISPVIKQIKTDHRQESEIFIGFKGITTAYEIMLSTAHKNEEFLYFNALRDDAVYEYFTKINSRFRQSGVILKGIGNESLRNNKYIKSDKYNQNRFVDFPLPGMMDIFQDKILLIDWHKPTGILITSQEIADGLREYFRMIWKISKP